MHGTELVVLSSILVGGFICQWAAWRVQTPAILFLLLAGIMAGPVLGWLNPDELLGDLLTPLVSIAVALILFEGSLTLKLSGIRGHGSVVRNLITLGVLVTWVSSGFAAYYFLGWEPYLSALFGAIVTVSGPTVVMPLLRAVRPAKTVSNILRWESILIDPLGAILALLVFDVIVASLTDKGLGFVALTVGKIAGAGILLGILGGYLFGLALRKRLVPDLLRDYAALACVLAVFAFAESIQAESGLLAVTLMGVWLANMRGVELDDVLNFKESLTLLLVAGLFIVLAARIQLDELLAISAGAFSILLILQLVAGPLRAFLSSAGSDLSWRERLYIGWVFPRGIVAAAISALFALRLVELDYPGASNLVPLVFSIILGTVIIQSLTAGLMARLLGVSEPEPKGVLIVGSNPVAREIARAMHDGGHSVTVADSHWASVRAARMLGLPVFFGSAVSGYAEANMDLAGLGTLLAMSRRPGLNELACVRFSNYFGRDNVYILGNQSEAGHDKHKVSGESAGRILFNGDKSLEEIQALLEAGASLKTTALTDEFGFDAYKREHADALPLFAFDGSGRVHFPVSDEDFHPEHGWAVTSLIQPTVSLE